MRVSESNLPPEHWRPFFDAINVEFGYRPLANKIGMDHTRLRRCLLGGGTSVETVQKVADVFGIDPGRVRELRGEGRDAAVDRSPCPMTRAGSPTMSATSSGLWSGRSLMRGTAMPYQLIRPRRREHKARSLKDRRPKAQSTTLRIGG